MSDGKRVLVVDDDPDVRQLLHAILHEAGYVAHPAVDGAHALRSAMALKPDLIILDICLPEPSIAISFADTYRARIGTERRAPIIAISASPDLETLGQRLGASELVSKPFDNEDLLRRVAKYLADPAPAVEPAQAAAEDAAAIVVTAEPGTTPA